MKRELKLVPAGLAFNEAEHSYFLNGKYLSGITGMIAKRLKMRMPQEIIGEAQAEGQHVHTAVSGFINGGELQTIHTGAQWVVEKLIEMYSGAAGLYSEVLVSDAKQYASAVDIVVNTEGEELDILDIKRTFNRTYVTWQLSIYKYFIEKYSDYKVMRMYCAAFRDKTLYPVFAFATEDVENLLYRESTL